MKVNVWIEIRGSIDSLLLWKLIEGYELNLTDLLDKCLVYGDCSCSAAGSVVSICALFGELTVYVRPV